MIGALLLFATLKRGHDEHTGEWETTQETTMARLAAFILTNIRRGASLVALGLANFRLLQPRSLACCKHSLRNGALFGNGNSKGKGGK